MAIPSIQAGTGCVVLLVQEDVRARGAIAGLLQLEGYYVLAARDPGEAFARASGLQPCVSLFDVGPSGAAGRRILEALRAALASRPVRHVAMAAIASHAPPDADGVLVMPFTAAALTGTLKRVCGHAHR